MLLLCSAFKIDIKDLHSENIEGFKYVFKI